VCEDHPDQPMHHVDARLAAYCGGAGQPCQDYRCRIAKNPPPLPPGWQSIVRVHDRPQGLVRAEWRGKQQRLAQCWNLQKDRRTAICELLNHPFGWELRVNVSGELVRSQ
jgi:hypothetical protein